MSRGHRAWSLGPPGAHVLTVLVLAGVVAACHGARSATSPSADSPFGSVARGVASKQNNVPLRTPPGLAGKTWLAEGPRGWEAGRVGGRRAALGKDEVGLAVSDKWILSAIFPPDDSVQLLVREGPGADPKVIGLGALAPTATAISGDRAYVSGFLMGSVDEPGILEIDLRTAVARAVLEPSGAAGTRYLAVSPDGSTLVSSLCDLSASPEPASCALTAVHLADGVARDLGKVAGGLLRATTSDVAVVAQQGHEAPAWIAGIDLHSGAELWRVAGGEFGPSLLHPRRGLIQQRLVIDGKAPRLVIEALELRSGARQTIYEELRPVLRALWASLCTDTELVLGDDATGRRSIAAGADAKAHIRLVPLGGGQPADLELSLRSEP